MIKKTKALIKGISNNGQKPEFKSRNGNNNKHPDRKAGILTGNEEVRG